MKVFFVNACLMPVLNFYSLENARNFQFECVEPKSEKPEA